MTMSMQVKLIPIYIEDINLISVNNDEYDNFQDMTINDIQIVDENDKLNKLITNKQEQFGEQTTFKTNMKNKDLLIKAISKYAQRFKDEEQLADFINKGSLEISQTRRGTYNIVFHGYFRDDEKNYITNFIQDEYNYMVQEETYRKVAEHIKKKNYEILSEDIDDEDSIVMTINI